MRGTGTMRSPVARAHGVETMFTLSGAHVFPMYDAAVEGRPADAAARRAARADRGVRRRGDRQADPHARARRATAGPGVTNGVSAVTTAYFNGSPLLVVGGRAPAFRWGTGSLQELDHPPLLAPVTKRAATVDTVEAIADRVDDAFSARHRTAPRPGVPRRTDGPALQPRRRAAAPSSRCASGTRPTRTTCRAVGAAARRRRTTGAGPRARTSGPTARRTRRSGWPRPPRSAVITNGMGRGVLPAGHPLLVTRARGAAFGQADLVVVVGHAAGLPARLRHLRRQGRSASGSRRAPRRLTRPAGRARRARRRRQRATSRWCSTAC